MLISKKIICNLLAQIVLLNYNIMNIVSFLTFCENTAYERASSNKYTTYLVHQSIGHATKFVHNYIGLIKTVNSIIT